MNTFPQVYFYPHAYMRDRQLDTIRSWPTDRVLNPEIADRRGSQVSVNRALAPSQAISWKQRLPLLNIKRRPRGLPREAAVYVWGAIMASGPFIVALDNPYALTGYNYRALGRYRRLLQALLESHRCLAIHCMSQACREGVAYLFGQAVADKAIVDYPKIRQEVQAVPESQGECRFLFIGTQFEIKGGAALLAAFEAVRKAVPSATLDCITHLPPEYESLVNRCAGLTIFPAELPREEIYQRFMRTADVLVHPTYIESFGMVVLEALAHGLAIITTDVYALKEMVHDGRNGFVLPPPISAWSDYLPTPHLIDWPHFKDRVRNTDTAAFTDRLAEAMIRLAADHQFRTQARRESLRVLADSFLARPSERLAEGIHA
ncbi:MAG: glycosyltransferase family 4 protein [Candidatus Sericytochromatia bacterium]|nr:glycosyltransferase family 4 protein [Candidatus Tanganyikabacteria bacterium]